MYAFASSSTPAATNSDDVIRIADGLDQIARDAAFAADGQPGRATLFVSATPHADFSPNAYVTSLADNNFIYVNGTFRGAFNRGQTLEFDAAQGDIVTSDRGVTGVYSLSGGPGRPVEMASAAFAGRQFFWYAFRPPPHRHFIQSLAMPAKCQFLPHKARCSQSNHSCDVYASTGNKPCCCCLICINQLSSTKAKGRETKDHQRNRDQLR